MPPIANKTSKLALAKGALESAKKGLSDDNLKTNDQLHALGESSPLSSNSRCSISTVLQKRPITRELGIELANTKKKLD